MLNIRILTFDENGVAQIDGICADDALIDPNDAFLFFHTSIDFLFKGSKIVSRPIVEDIELINKFEDQFNLNVNFFNIVEISDALKNFRKRYSSINFDMTSIIVDFVEKIIDRVCYFVSTEMKQ